MTDFCFKHFYKHLVVPAIWCCCAAYALLTAPSVFAQYSGPAVSSRGLKQAGSRGSEPVSIRPYASVSAVADSGLLAVGTDTTGKLTNIGTLYGVEANIGAYGSRMWRATRLGLDYQGNYRHYNANTYFNGSDHLLSLDYARQIERRTTVDFRTSLGTSSRTVGGVFGFQGLDPSFFGVPANEIFDNRAYFADVSGQLSRTVGSRNTFSMGGGAFGVRRQSKLLIGINGYRALGAYSRQIDRKTSVGVSYAYVHVDYPRVFGEADINSLQLQVNRQINRSWVVSAALGAYRSDTSGTRTVQLDPLVAELLGASTGREAFNTINVNPMLNFGVTWTGRNSLFNVGYSRGANPGNGLLMVNNQENAMAGYTYTWDKRISLSGRGGYMSNKGLGAYSGSFTTYTIGSFFSYILHGGLQLTSGIDYRKFDSNSTGFNRNGSRIMVGIAYSGGELPISFH